MKRIIQYEQYKDSGVSWLGLIPAHWQTKRLKFIFKIEKKIAEELGHDVLSITQNGIMVKDIESGVGQLALDYSKYQRIESGQFAMNHMDLITGYVDISKHNGVISPDYRVFSLRDNNFDKKFLLRILQICYFEKIFFPFGQGAAQQGRWRLPAINFKNFLFPLPPKNEQEIISRFLDYKIGKIENFIDKKNKLLKLLYERILTSIQCSSNLKSNNDSRFWPFINPNWELEKAKRIFSEIKIKNYPNEELLAVTQNRGVIPKSLCEENFVLPTTGIDNQKLVVKGDFVISLRSFQGGIEYSEYRGIVSPAYTIIRLKEKHADTRLVLFYKYLFKSKQFIAQLNTAISGIRDGKNITWSDFAELILPIPNKEDLEELTDIVGAYERQKDIFTNERKLLKEYRQALISNAIRGRIDIREHE